jgi:dihydroneopterin aldolase
MDIIFLHEVLVSTKIGVYPHERTQPQTLQLELEIGIPSQQACHTDQLADTIDYAEVVARLRQTLAEQDFYLLEALADHIARVIMLEFGAPWVRLSLAKLGIIDQVRRVGVTIERGQRTG